MATEGSIVVETNDGRTFKFAPGLSADTVLEVLAADVGACVRKPARLCKNQQMFPAGAVLPAGTYTYEVKEKCHYDSRFGHLVTPSSQDFKTSREIQHNPRLRNLNFRPAEAAPFLPLQLVHEVFAHFLDDIRSSNLQPTQVDYDFFVQLAVAASEMLDEPELKARMMDLCQEYFVSFEIVEEMYRGALKQRDSRGTATDLGMRICNAVLLLCETKKSISGTTTDPQMQGIGNYKLHWTTRRPGTAQSFADTAYPAFLMELVGQWLKIGGLVTLGGDSGSEFGGKVCYQPLASVDLYAIHRHDLATAEQGVKVFMALKKALESLKDYWVNLVVAGSFPDPTLETLIHHKKLPYLLHPYGNKVEQIGDRLVYVVKGGLSTKYTGDYVVKFVQTYGTEVHLAWGNAGLAPKLKAVFEGPGGGWMWLAMELLEEEDGWKCFGQLEAKVADELRPRVLEFLDKAHRVQVTSKNGSPGYGVHGDMRDANVMVLLDGQTLKDVKFIDFDWAKVQGDADAVYPGFMNASINWPAGVEAGRPMLQEHDRSLLQLARGQQLKDSGLSEKNKRRKHGHLKLPEALKTRFSGEP